MKRICQKNNLRKECSRNIKLVIEYDGTLFKGWQVQKNNLSVQQVIQETLGKITRHSVTLYGSGRTDAGVHAKAQVANFKTSDAIKCKNMQKALNSMLPAGVAVSGVAEVDKDFHARYSAKIKHYRYLILNRKIPTALERNRVWLIPYRLDIKAMEKGASYLIGKYDFKSFGVNPKYKVNNTVKTIFSVSVVKSGAKIRIDIIGDGFLYKMVRSIVGTLVDIGRGKIKPEDMKRILRSKERCYASKTAPAQGLYLYKVTY